MSIRQIIQSCLVIFLIYGCQHEPPEGPPVDLAGSTDGTGTDPIICDSDTVYFQQAVLPLIVSSCAIPGCHDPGSNEDGVTLNNYQNIFNTGEIDPFDLDGSDLYEVITDSDPDDRMPPAGEYPPLSSDEIAIIRNWILQGALNNSCESAECDTTNVTYTASIEPIISAKCTGCHSGANPEGEINLENYAQVSSEVLFGDVLAAVQHLGGVTNMPYNSSQLPQCEIDLIRIWKENEAPE